MVKGSLQTLIEQVPSLFVGQVCVLAGAWPMPWQLWNNRLLPQE